MSGVPFSRTCSSRRLILSAFISSVGLAIASVGLAMYGAFASPSSAGLVLLDSRAGEFDSVPVGIVTGVFELENQSYDEIRIVRVQGSCGCTATSLSKERLGSGEKGQVVIRWNLKGRTGEAAADVSIFYRTSDGQIRMLTLPLHARVMQTNAESADSARAVSASAPRLDA